MSSFDDLNKNFPSLSLGVMDITKYEPGGKVTATKTECVGLANSINTSIDNFNKSKHEFIVETTTLQELRTEFDRQVEIGKTALPAYLNAVKAMDALVLACKRVQECDSTEVSKNMQMYKEKASGAMTTISSALNFINDATDKANKTASKMRSSFEKCVSFGLEVTQNLRPKFETCENVDGTVVVSIKQPGESSVSSEFNTGGVPSSGDSGVSETLA